MSPALLAAVVRTLSLLPSKRDSLSSLVNELRFQGFRVPGPLRRFHYLLEQEDAVTVETVGFTGTTYVSLTETP